MKIILIARRAERDGSKLPSILLGWLWMRMKILVKMSDVDRILTSCFPNTRLFFCEALLVRFLAYVKSVIR